MAKLSMDGSFGEFAALSRRRFITGVALLAATGGLAARRAVGQTPDSERPELFAFSAPDGEHFVFALAFAMPLLEPAKHNLLGVRLHVGEFCWMIRPSTSERSVAVLPEGERVFSGAVWRRDCGSRMSHLIAVALPAWRICARVGIWAEIVGPGTERARVGHPLAARLLRGSDDLTRLHGETDPATDCSLLSEAIARQIAACRTDQQGAGVQARAERLAELLLPDLLWFDPARPGGFTFAAMNGRRPCDSVDQIVETLLAGSARCDGDTAPYRASGEFPYFATTDVI
jgi:hypothetical protein